MDIQYKKLKVTAISNTLDFVFLKWELYNY